MEPERAPPPDRLTQLGMVRGALRFYRLDSPEAWRRASAKERGELEPWQAAFVRRALREGNPDVLAALFDSPDWYVALLLTGPADRLLCIEGQEPIRYRADDPDAERRAWAAIRAATS